MLTVVRRLMLAMLRQGRAYQRADVALMDLARPDELQCDLFDPPTIGNDALMATLG